MSTGAWATGRALGCATPATPCAPDVSSIMALPTPAVAARPEDFPEVEALAVDWVLSGEYELRTAMLERGLSPVVDGFAEPETPYTGPTFNGCECINVWGLSENASEEDLLYVSRKFGTVIRVCLFNPQAQGDLGCATVLFEKPSAARRAQFSLHRTLLHGKEIRVGWGLNTDERETSSHYWLPMWISRGTTAEQLYKGFLREGAPCTDACVVRESGAEDPEGVGVVAFRTEEEFYAIRDALPWSCKTDFTKHPTWNLRKCAARGG